MKRYLLKNNTGSISRKILKYRTDDYVDNIIQLNTVNALCHMSINGAISIKLNTSCLTFLNGHIKLSNKYMNVSVYFEIYC